MLPTAAMLGKEAWPVLGVHRHLDTCALTVEKICTLTRHHRLHRSCALTEDAEIFDVTNDTKPEESVPVIGYVAISEVHP